MAKAAAMLCGVAGMVANQGEALHLLGAALFHAGGDSNFEAAVAAFSASAEAKRACGVDGGRGLAAGESDFSAMGGGRLAGLQPATAAEANASAQYVETLLFLAKLSFEVKDLRGAEEAQNCAMAVARGRLGDSHPVTRKAISALVDLRTRMRTMTL